MDNTEFSLQLANYLVNQTGTNKAIIIENFLNENNLIVSDKDSLATAGGWSVEGVYDYLLNDQEITLTIEDARAIWNLISDKSDATVGINDSEVNYWAEEYFKNNG
jgi:hypothetical protein